MTRLLMLTVLGLLLAGCRPSDCEWRPAHRDTLTEHLRGEWRCPAPGR